MTFDRFEVHLETETMMVQHQPMPPRNEYRAHPPVMTADHHGCPEHHEINDKGRGMPAAHTNCGRKVPVPGSLSAASIRRILTSAQALAQSTADLETGYRMPRKK